MSRIEVSGCLDALEGAGVVGPIPGGGLGVVGIDGRAYPVPTPEQLDDVLARNGDLVEEKAAQGFTRLLLTPLAMPVPELVERVGDVVRGRHEVLRTKRDASDPDAQVRVSTAEPVWVWERLRRTLDTPAMVYFPRSYTRTDHGGLAKGRAMVDPALCALPGWSVGLVEDIPIMPRRGEARVVGGRRQLEAGWTPKEYLGTLGGPSYRGETGWTLEDLLVHFADRLVTTGEISHDRSDGNALWLLGAYVPALMPRALVVPTGAWASKAGRRLYIGAHRTNNRLRDAVARSVVRLQGGRG